MKLNRFFAVLLTLASIATLSQGGGFKDDFSDPKLEIRQALRGEWIFEKGVATCVSDPELYEKFANHGPILRWPCEITDGSMAFEFKPEDCQRVVITFNGEGHIFRISLTEENKSSIFGWIGLSSKENKPQNIAREGVPSIESLDGKWTPVKLTIQGENGQIQIGDYKSRFKHGSLARKKTEFTISFASGSCAVRNVALK